ncbi:hypothetical protein [Pelagibacterium lentulum]|uniref:Uncharacterized protein n=1 Tax=Pelagibacterium lentulum TaxID=2029865 RepID=A0A916RQM3_9HYPH|nr:hypothetical protein [Pelagibacterium lentulum]GGA64612.1 hypothetical protein GCM10011499_38850 [Pelagibacterium lentulum]
MVNMKTAKCPTCGGMVLKLAGKAGALCHDQCSNCRDNENEAAYERQQASLMESGGPDDSAYRRDMIAAGRGHLIR